MAEVVGAGAEQERRPAAANGEGPGQPGNRRDHHHHAKQAGGDHGGVGVMEHVVEGVTLTEQTGQALHLGIHGEPCGDGHAGDTGDPHQPAEQPGAVCHHGEERQQGRTEQGGHGPGPPEQILVPAHLLGRKVADVGGAEQDGVAVEGVGEGPGEPEQPERPELDGDAQRDPEQVVAGALDHSAASAAFEAFARPAVSPTWLAVPPWVLARAVASSKRARPSQCCMTRL